MKKILNFFDSLSLITSTVSSVVACGSTHPYIQPTEVQTLYNKLNETTKPFLIENKNFWGKEANYQADLLQDLEEVAHIPVQDDLMLSFTNQMNPFEKPNQTYQIGVDIKDPNTGEEKTALVNIDWELTKEQSEIYDFYVNYWPHYVEENYQGLLKDFNNLYKSIITQTTNGWTWPKNKEQSLTWQQYAKWLYTNDKSIIYSSVIRNYFHVKQNVGVDHINVDQKTTLQISPFYLQVGKVTFDLPYYVDDPNYPPFDSETPAKILPATKLWTVSYNNDYQLLQDLKKDIQQHSYGLPLIILERNTNPSEASNPDNTKSISDAITNYYDLASDYDYGYLTGHMTYNGTLYVTKEGSPKELAAINPISFSYYGIKQDFTLPVEAENWGA